MKLILKLEYTKEELDSYAQSGSTVPDSIEHSYAFLDETAHTELVRVFSVFLKAMGYDGFDYQDSKEKFTL